MTSIKPQCKIACQDIVCFLSNVRRRLALDAVTVSRMCVITAWLVVGGVCVESAHAQDQVDQANQADRTGPVDSADKASTVEATKTATKNQPTKSAKVSAREAVRLGNKHLIEGDAKGALQYYDEAQQLEPNAPQIAYVKGLGYFAAENYDEARQAFEQAAASDNDQLAGDAIYGAGITYHAQALASLDDPKAAIGNLESALERYRTVLAHEPNHQAAKDAEVKAAMLRRQLVEQVKQQESQSCDNPKESDEAQKDKDKDKDKEENKKEDKDKDKDKDKKDGQQDDKQKQEQQDKQDQQQDSDKQDEQKEQQSSQDEKSDNEDSKQSDQSESKENDEKEQSDSSKQAENSDEQQQQKQAQQAKESAEDSKKEQAQRRLREMMDAMRNRKKRRPAQPLPIPVKPVDKDW